MVEKAPQAEALAASWMLSVRPLATRVYALRRRIATITVAVLAGLLFVHVMFGANGMIVYKQKRVEYRIAAEADRAGTERKRTLYADRFRD